MARNKEKHVVGLNRIWLQTLDEEIAKKNPPRPGLGSLHTSAEVKKWIPSIKKDIDFCLKQSQVTCYPESHVQDFSSRIEALTREYKAYVRKLRDLEPKSDVVPWTDRPYKRKYGDIKETEDNSVDADGDTSKTGKTDFATISAPILDSDDTYSELYGYNENTEATTDASCINPPYCINPELEDQPLVFVNKQQLSIEAGTQEESFSYTKYKDCLNTNDGLCSNCHKIADPSKIDPQCEACIQIRVKVVNSNEIKRDKISQCRKVVKAYEIHRPLQPYGTESTNNQSVNVTHSGSTSTCTVSEQMNSPTSAKRPAKEAIKLYIPYSDSSSEEEESD